MNKLIEIGLHQIKSDQEKELLDFIERARNFTEFQRKLVYAQLTVKREESLANLFFSR